MKAKPKNDKGCAVFFDSGIGGINLMYECVRRVPAPDYYYIADNKNVPYGNRSADEIFALVTDALKGVEELNPMALVVACNTVTAECVNALRGRYSFPVVGIQPAVKQAAEVGGRCLVLATEATVASASFQSLVSEFDNLEIEVRACRELAAYVEKNIFNLPERLPKRLLPNLSADSVVLGCTHYSYVKKQISSLYNCPVFDGISGTADHFAKIVGMADHRHTFLGKTDHLRLRKGKINFILGNINKNKRIFSALTRGYIL